MWVDLCRCENVGASIRTLSFISLKMSLPVVNLNKRTGNTMKPIKLEIKTSGHTQMLDITNLISRAVSDSGIKSGICTVFIPHTTAAVTINENADPAVVRDFTTEINKIVPWEDGYHHMEGNSAAHLKSSIIGFSEQIIIEEGRLLLGTWRGVYFCEYDGPRKWKVYLKIMEE